MTRVLIPGNKLVYDTYTGKCDRCKCIFECINQDMTFPVKPGLDGYIACPNCQYSVTPVFNGGPWTKRGPS